MPPNKSTVAFEVTAPKANQTDAGNYAGGASALAAQIAQLDIASLASSVSSIVDQFSLQFSPREGGPSQCELEFGIKVNAEGSIIVSKLGGEASLKIKVTWKHG